MTQDRCAVKNLLYWTSLGKFQLLITGRSVYYGTGIKMKTGVKEEYFSNHVKITVGRIDIN